MRGAFLSRLVLIAGVLLAFRLRGRKTREKERESVHLSERKIGAAGSVGANAREGENCSYSYSGEWFVCFCRPFAGVACKQTAFRYLILSVRTGRCSVPFQAGYIGRD